MTVLRSGCFSLRYFTTKSYMAGSSGVLRNTQGDSLASPNLVAMSVKKRSWSPLSEASPSFFWSVPKTGSATDEQPGPREKITLSTVARRRSEEHTSELQSRPHLVCRPLLGKKKNEST